MCNSKKLDSQRMNVDIQNCPNEHYGIIPTMLGRTYCENAKQSPLMMILKTVNLSIESIYMNAIGITFIKTNLNSIHIRSLGIHHMVINITYYVFPNESLHVAVRCDKLATMQVICVEFMCFRL